MSLFSIPGDIKQQYLPFVLNNTDTSPQLFSFRDVNKDDFKGGVGRLQICPSSMTNLNFGNYFEDDISYKLLFGNNNGVTTGKSISLNDILNTLPGVEIREFLPDTKLDQTINFFDHFIDNLIDLFSSDDDKYEVLSQELDKQNKTQLAIKKEQRVLEKIKNEKRSEKINKILKYSYNYLAGNNSNDMYSNLWLSIDDFCSLGNSSSLYDGDRPMFFSKIGDCSSNSYILHFPYLLYYRLQSCTTNNLYVLPCKVSDNAMYSSDGKPGWVGGTNSIGLVNTELENFPLFGKIIKNILGNVAINFMPWWDAGAGAQTPPPEINIKFDLYNDTEEAAMINFIFVNTIVPNNKWLQYGMFQHSPNLYDIKIEGYNRLFACAGSFSVQAEGVLRTPSKKWINDLLTKYLNSKYIVGNDILTDLIKIPDVYTVDMTFQSLLPANFNNFLYTYSNNNVIVSTEEIEGKYEKTVNAISTGFSNYMSDYIKNEISKKEL